MTAAVSLDVSRFLDDRPIGWRQWVVFGLCMMVLAIDVFDNTAKELFMFLSCPALIGLLAVLLKLNSQRNAAAVQAN